MAKKNEAILRLENHPYYLLQRCFVPGCSWRRVFLLRKQPSNYMKSSTGKLCVYVPPGKDKEDGNGCVVRSRSD